MDKYRKWQIFQHATFDDTGGYMWEFELSSG